jgi:hypothetical protein
LLGDHEEKSSQKIMELEALCNRLREDARKLKEENTKLEGMVKSRGKLITEIAKVIGLDRVGEDVEAEVEDDNDRGDAATPPIAMVPPLAPAPPAAAAPEEIIVEVVGAAIILGNMKAATSGDRAAPFKTTIMGTRKVTKCNKEQKRCPRCIIATASDDGNNEKADDSARSMSCPTRVILSIRCGSRRTISRNFFKQHVQTIHTRSNTTPQEMTIHLSV